MNARVLVCCLLLAGLAAGLPTLLAAQEPEQAKEMDPVMAAWLKYASPGEHHKHLQAFVGRWDAKAKLWPAPGAPVQESTGIAEHSPVLGGRFVKLTYKSQFMEQPFEGVGYIGYDNYKQQYSDVWMDTMGTMIMTSEGSCDGSGTMVTMEGDYEDPVSGSTKAVKSVYKFQGPDQYVLAMYELAPDGQEFKSLEIVHTRAKPAQISEGERHRATHHLQATRRALLDATTGLSQAQLDFKPGPDRWSVAECLEHLAATEDFLFQLITERVMTTPSSHEPRADLAATDDWVLARISDRSVKAQAPEPVRPTGRFGSAGNSIDHFLARRARTLEFLEATPDLRSHSIDSPVGRKLDAYQWLLFISAHTERHTKQIHEVKADPNFPKS